MTAAQNALGVAAILAVLALGQWLDGPSDMQHAQDVAAEVAAVEAEAIAMRVQHPSVVEPVRRRHVSMVVAQKGR